MLLNTPVYLASCYAFLYNIIHCVWKTFVYRLYRVVQKWEYEYRLSEWDFIYLYCWWRHLTSHVCQSQRVCSAHA